MNNFNQSFGQGFNGQDDFVFCDNFQAVESAGNFEALPAGDYQARATSIELVDTRDKTGKRLKVQFSITTGPHRDRIVFGGFNLVNRNREAVEIAVKEIKSWFEAASIPVPAQLAMSHIMQLEGREVVLTLKVRQQQGYDDQNEVKRFKPVTAPAYGATPGPTFAQPAPTAAAQAPAGFPWAGQQQG